MRGVVRESLGAYRGVLRSSLHFQGGECHMSRKADLSRKIALFTKILYGWCYHKKLEGALLLSSVTNAE